MSEVMEIQGSLIVFCSSQTISDPFAQGEVHVEVKSMGFRMAQVTRRPLVLGK